MKRAEQRWPTGIHQCFEFGGILRIRDARHSDSPPGPEQKHEGLGKRQKMPPLLNQPRRPAQYSRKVSARMRPLHRHEGESAP